MKVFSFIFAFFLLSLNVAPCTDYGDAHAQESYADLMNGHDHNHDKEPQSEDDCSPFCICDCCHLHATISQEKIAFLEDPSINATFSYQINYSERDLIAPFVPPRA